MSDPSLAMQRAIRTRLIDTAAVTALVPANNIVDRNQRPVLDPSIVLGEDQIVDEGADLMRSRVRVYQTLHIWKRENSLTGVKAISGGIRRAIRSSRFFLNDADFQCVDCRISSARFLRDPDGETSHGIVTLDCLVTEKWVLTI